MMMMVLKKSQVDFIALGSSSQREESFIRWPERKVLEEQILALEGPIAWIY